VELRTPEGNVVFPSPVLQAIEMLTQGQTARIETPYGETFVGTATSRRWETLRLVDDGPEADRGLVPGGCVRIPGPSKAVPMGWLFWRLKTGNAFCARFADEDPYLELREVSASRDSRMPADQVIAIRPLSTLFTITTATGATVAGRFSRATQAVVALSTGTRLTVPWSKVFDVTNSAPAIRPADSRTGVFVATTNESHRESRNVVEMRSSPSLDGPRRPTQTIPGLKPPSAPVALVIRTNLGDVALPTNVLAAVHTPTRGRVSVVETVLGEVFVADRVSERDLKTVGLAIPPLAASRGKVPTTLRLAAASVPLPPDMLAWRLKSGHVFYGRPLAALGGTLVGSTARHVEVPPESLVSALPSEDGAFDVGTLDGPRRIRPKTVSLPIRSALSSAPLRVRLEDIECINRGALRDLPPPVSFRPDSTPFQEGVVGFPAGSFTMGRTRGDGAEDEIPVRTVRLGAFWMDVCEVTRAQFAEFVRQTGFKTEAERIGSTITWRTPGFRQAADEPAVGITWTDAAQYCNWRSKEAGLHPCYEFGVHDLQTVCRRDQTGYRLPTEAEWEYAARAGGGDNLFPWGDDGGASNAIRRANFEQAAGGPQDGWIWTCPVKTFPPTDSGLYGIAGNVWEWCEDWYDPRAYSAAIRFASEDPCTGVSDVPHASRRVMRGGSYANGADMLRCTSRGNGVPTAWTRKAAPPHVGFRCVRNMRAP
jgi:formylglycine-generating enzyme required for sulfatase activity